MRGPELIHGLFDQRRRGLLVDIVVFLVSLVLFYVLGAISRNFTELAETDTTAELAIGVFFVVLLSLQPWGPLLKRRPFHRRHPEFAENQNGLLGCAFPVIGFFYLIMMLIIAGAASTMITEAAFAGNGKGATLGPIGVLVGLAWAVLNAVLFVRFFYPPKRPARRKLFDSPFGEGIADLTIFLNLICLQLVWGSVMSSQIFWEVVINTPLGKPNSATAIMGRFIVITVVALMVYLPPRLFFLVEQKHRRMAWLTMAIANLPIILKALLATGK